MQFEFRGFMEFPFGLLSAPLTYDAPTLAQMRAKVMQDLRDPEGKTISVDEATDLVRMAIIEVSSVYPKEATDVITLEAGTYRYPTLVQEPFRVELVTVDGVFVIEPGDGVDVRNGWDHFAGVLDLPQALSFSVTGNPDTTDLLRVWGYAPRIPPDLDDDVVDVDAKAERAIRLNAALTGYQRLVNDRTLYSQWNTASGNTDVTMSQLVSLAQVFSQQWDAERRRLRVLRRS